MEGTVTGKKLVGTLSSGGSMTGGVGTVFARDGITPHIGENGNWWVGDKDTGVQAQGEQGLKGEKGDTGAQGIQGIQGVQGVQGIQGDKGETGEKGDKGDTGSSGVYIGTAEPTDASVNVWINPSGREVPFYNGEVL
jgi:hypothetical protein